MSKSEEEKLLAMEADVKAMCEDLDLQKEALKKEKETHDKSIAKFNKANKIVNSSESFNKMVTLVDEIYTMYVAHHGTAGGLYESIKLLLDSRAKFSDALDKK